MKVRVLFANDQQYIDIEATGYDRCAEYLIVRERYKDTFPYTRSVHVIPYANVLDIVIEEDRR